LFLYEIKNKKYVNLSLFILLVLYMFGYVTLEEKKLSCFHIERSVKVTTENHRYENIDDLCLSLSRINTILGENIFQER
jgi:hypothetical protein